MKRAAQQLVREAEELGYVHDRTNSQGYLVYVHPSGHEVQICPSAAKHQARAVSKAMRKTAGTWQPAQGRNARAVKDRAGRRRELTGERLAAEHARNKAERDAYLARIEAVPLLRADPEIVAALEANARRRRELEALMTAVPSVGEHQGHRHARHTAGVRS